MKNIYLTTVVLIISCIAATFLFANTYYVPDMASIHNSHNEKKSAEMIKKRITAMRDALEINADRFPELIQELKQEAERENNVPAKAILHSMLAEMYQQYYQMNAWRIGQRTKLEGFVPDDIREWTTNLFNGEIANELDASLQPASALQQIAASDFEELWVKNDEKKIPDLTLYDLLMSRAMDIKPTTGRYEQWVSFLRTRLDKRALVMAELRYQNFTFTNTEQFEAGLDSLLQQYAGQDVSVEIVDAKLSQLQQKEYTTKNADSVRTIAYELATETIRRFPDYDRIDLIRNRINQMEKPSLSVNIPKSVYTGKELVIDLTYTNISAVEIVIYESDRTIEQTSSNHPRQEKTENKNRKLVHTEKVPLPFRTTYLKEEKQVRIPMEKAGLYDYVIQKGDTDIKLEGIFSVTALAANYRTRQEGVTEVFVTDLLSGKPVKGATVNYFGGKRNQLTRMGSVETDTHGLATLPKDNTIYAYQASLDSDNKMGLTDLYTYWSEPVAGDEKTELTILTDRGIYRPGQTVYFKGIAFVSDPEHPKVMAGKRYEVIFRDTQQKEISKQTPTTNEYGSFHGEFTIPAGLLSGSFSIRAGESETYFRVEEYKRPSFQITIHPVKEDVKNGDLVTIRGIAKTFSDVPIQDGTVSYQITERPFWPFYGRGGTSLANGTAELTQQGEFTFSFRTTHKDNKNWYDARTMYEVRVTVTDSRGESQESTYTFSLGETSLYLTVDNLSDKIEKENADIIVRAQTFNGEKLDITGNFRIIQLQETGKEGQYKVDKEILSGQFRSNQSLLDKKQLQQIPSGPVRLRLTAKDSEGREVPYEQDFILYSRNDKKPPVTSGVWFIPTTKRYAPGESVELPFGTSQQNAYVLFEVFSANKLVKRELVEMSNENRTFRFTFPQDEKEGVMVSFTFVKNGELYTAGQQLFRQYPDRSLTIRPGSFRDKLVPGSSEKWSFRVTDADSTGVTAEILASMYDVSLDKISPFSWHFAPEKNLRVPYQLFSRSSALGNQQQSDNNWIRSTQVPSYNYPVLDWQGVMNYMYSGGMLRAGGLMTKNAAAPARATMRQEVAGEAVMAYSSMDMVTADNDSAVEEDSADGNSRIRQNFQETAFFFPQLLTDKEGNLEIGFSIPESNTTWKFQLVPHTKDLKYGQHTMEVITQKPVMVQPYLPRFLRKGDKVTLSTQVINQTEEAISGLVRIELFNPYTDQPVLCLTKSQMPFNLEPMTNKTVFWNITVPETEEVIGIRIIADSDKGSDGEQHILPVVSNQILVTESTPFYLPAIGEKTVQVPEPPTSSTRKNVGMTLEFTGNPSWNAIQVLPGLSRPENESVMSWFGSYYSHVLSGSIVRRFPRMQQIIAAWQLQGADNMTLASNLIKNEELQSVLLEETPWVLDAESETEQIQRLSLLFDLNRSEQAKADAFNVLKEQQLDSGAWGWFKGMVPNRQMTIEILKGMAQLVELEAIQYNQQEKEMQIKALNWLDNQINADYKALMKQKKGTASFVPDALLVDYLYMRSSYRDIPEGEAREAVKFFTAQAEKQWEKMPLAQKAETAILLHRNGKNENAGKIVQWFRKTATQHEEMGMYWANNRRGNSFFASPVETHSLILSMFIEVDPGREEINRMKQWLLNQKRTQRWETVPATVYAVHAMLLRGDNWLADENTFTIRWGKDTFTESDGIPATGYIKKAIPATDIDAGRHTVTIRKNDTHPAWGAVYYQYMEDMDKVENSHGSLDIEKLLFKETTDGTNRRITPVTTNSPLKPGDKGVIRLTIRSDRDMDYVHIKDTRAGCFEPLEQISGLRYRDGLRYYESPEDVSEHFFFDHLPAGTYVIEYPVYVSRTGDYSSGISMIQCMYAPEFMSHTGGERILIKD